MFNLLDTIILTNVELVKMEDTLAFLTRCLEFEYWEWKKSSLGDLKPPLGPLQVESD